MLTARTPPVVKLRFPVLRMPVLPASPGDRIPLTARGPEKVPTPPSVPWTPTVAAPEPREEPLALSRYSFPPSTCALTAPAAVCVRSSVPEPILASVNAVLAGAAKFPAKVDVAFPEPTVSVYGPAPAIWATVPEPDRAPIVSALGLVPDERARVAPVAMLTTAESGMYWFDASAAEPSCSVPLAIETPPTKSLTMPAAWLKTTAVVADEPVTFTLPAPVMRPVKNVLLVPARRMTSWLRVTVPL